MTRKASNKVPRRQLRAGFVLAAAFHFAACGSAPAVDVATSRVALAGEATKVIVVLRKISGATSEPALIKQVEAAGRLKRRYKKLPAVAARLTAEEIAALSHDSSVAYIEADQRLAATPAVSSAEESASWGVAHIGAADAHASGITGANVKVAVLDTGVDYTHPELSPRYCGGYDFMYETSDPFDDSYDSHGTHVAGIIAASLDGNGMVGVAPGVSLYAVKVLDGAGFGDLSTILGGLDWAIANGMDVVNMSFGSPMSLQILEDACNAAADAGIVLVAATGYRNSDPVSYPAGYASVIGVSATDQNDLITPFSPAGPGVTMVAPGLSILSTQSGGGYVTLSGTSQAAPHVAGVAALILSAGIADANGDGRLSDDVRGRLLATARDLGATGRDDQYGQGLADVRRALGLCKAPKVVELVRTSRPPADDAGTLSLAASTYSIELVNQGLSGVQVDVRSAGEVKWRSFDFFHLDHRVTTPVTFTLTLESALEVAFVPQGAVGSSAQVTVGDQSAACP
jgi:subtilisin